MASSWGQIREHCEAQQNEKPGGSRQQEEWGTFLTEALDLGAALGQAPRGERREGEERGRPHPQAPGRSPRAGPLCPFSPRPAAGACHPLRRFGTPGQRLGTVSTQPPLRVTPQKPPGGLGGRAASPPASEPRGALRAGGAPKSTAGAVLPGTGEAERDGRSRGLTAERAKVSVRCPKAPPRLFLQPQPPPPPTPDSGEHGSVGKCKLERVTLLTGVHSRLHILYNAHGCVRVLNTLLVYGSATSHRIRARTRFPGPWVSVKLLAYCQLRFPPDFLFFLEVQKNGSRRSPPRWKAGALRQLVFRTDETTPKVVRSVLLERGWKELGAGREDAGDWDLYWRATSFRTADYADAKPWQRLNHHPGTARLTRKDHLAKHLERMRQTYGSPPYAFTPLTFIMPSDYPKFMAEFCKEKQALGTKQSYWICKPAELSRGRGIVIFSDTRDLVFGDTYVLQKYICNPLLVGRYKCDLRVYVCVTSFRPLTVYLYQEGLVRFATEKFDLSNVQDPYAHLTNSSLNRRGPSYEKIKEVVGHGCKWTLSRFFSYLRNGGADDLLLWRHIDCLVILTVLAMAPSVPEAANCFDLFGFDILVDDTMKPWLLEVNYSPALSLDCSTDVSVKRRLVHDVIQLVFENGPRSEERERSRAASKNPSASLPKGGRSGPGGPPHPPPYPPLSQFTDGAGKKKVAAATKKASGLHPRHTRTSQLREMIHKPKDSLVPTGDASTVKPRLGSGPAPRETLPPPAPLARPRRYGAPAAPRPPSAPGQAPEAHTGNFALIFPFNDATLGASRNGLNVKRIIQELQKRTRHIAKGPNPEN
ncbi:probable tubulin polyglutamylase TTLL2 [Perognathus longimembris pacificus]|uniref:probable tubulin polyglutamylase TTLL2 n=1 Tax=Perognathus longimembris pacificus TaxID=214514 RepID=UPI002019D1C2|nr:probable tubulin polyglutamylase TTLL2 [Perognathus longimembris pacificus]